MRAGVVDFLRYDSLKKTFSSFTIGIKEEALLPGGSVLLHISLIALCIVRSLGDTMVVVFAPWSTTVTYSSVRVNTTYLLQNPTHIASLSWDCGGAARREP